MVKLCLPASSFFVGGVCMVTLLDSVSAIHVMLEMTQLGKSVAGNMLAKFMRTSQEATR